MSAVGCVNDDGQQWAEWIRAHGPSVRGYVAAVLRRPDLADEVAHEVFVRAWKARHRYRELGNARAYLLRIADRLVCDHFRKLGREVNLSDQQWEGVDPPHQRAEPMEAMMHTEACGKLAEALQGLSAPQRRVLLLRYYGDMSFAEIAGVMQCPLGTALSHAHRGLQALRALFVESEP